jgi:hypothetical protein
MILSLQPTLSGRRFGPSQENDGEGMARPPSNTSPKAPRRLTPGVALARGLAVVALAGAAIAVVAIVAGSGGTTTPTQAARGGGNAHHHHRPQPTVKYYVIKPGDTFEGIAAKVHVPAGRLQRLNPNLDVQQLPLNGCVNVVAEGCKVLAQGG